MAQPCWGVCAHEAAALHRPDPAELEMLLQHSLQLLCKDGILAAARGKNAILGWMATTVNNS